MPPKQTKQGFKREHGHSFTSVTAYSVFSVAGAFVLVLDLTLALAPLLVTPEPRFDNAMPTSFPAHAKPPP
ncbi:hypothetical protein DFJ73DRAFT_798505 [Zopfochytrium polystomum]|nr:hypothetical protein DFJ73DRAFT_798505 [Zopfochytrium polystomum]